MLDDRTATQASRGPRCACHLQRAVPEASSPSCLPRWTRWRMPDTGGSCCLRWIRQRRMRRPSRGVFADRGLVAHHDRGRWAPGADVSSEDADERGRGRGIPAPVVDFTVSLGGDQMNGSAVRPVRAAPPGRPRASAVERSAARGGPVADYAHERGMTMTFEVLNRYETSLVNTAAQAMAYVEASGSEHLRIHLDTFHMAVEEADIAGRDRRSRYRSSAFSSSASRAAGCSSTARCGVAEIVERAARPAIGGRWGVEAFSRSGAPARVAGMLAIWRSPYEDGAELAASAMRMIERAAGSEPRTAAEGRPSSDPKRMRKSLRERTTKETTMSTITQAAARPASTRRRSPAGSTSTASGSPAAAARSPRSNRRPARPWRWSASRMPPMSPAPQRAPPAHRRSGRRLPHPARAAVLRRAGQLWEEYAEEIWRLEHPRGGGDPAAGRASPCTSPPPSATRRPRCRPRRSGRSSPARSRGSRWRSRSRSAWSASSRRSTSR